MKRAAEKLKSSRGASLMMALLLFLVCAVIGSAVLVAGTAASGRMSKIAEMDRRYYAVNSAAGLLADLYKDEAVKIVVEDSGGASPTVRCYRYVSGSFTEVGQNYSLPVQTGFLLAAKCGNGASFTPTVALDVPGGAVAVTGTIFPDGRLEYTVSDADSNYKLLVVFAAQKSENKSIKTEETAEGTRTITTTETSITWKLSDVK